MNREYKNPIARNGDFADPFVLRHNGRYYLYATNYDIRCFSSENLLDWTLEGGVIEPGTFEGLMPFAPEVVCHDGRFYMYTSPSGFGHYVLESTSPTGPFRKISGNVGHAIDGNVFIDDDGRWYFYWAGDEGIWGCEMVSPTEFSEPVLTGAFLHGWTEGPFVYKQDGIYYMTYTGNHYLSHGYRIQAAWSKEPLSGYQDDDYNPVVIHTQGEGVGLGHSCTVTGPDLVSHYMVYHNINEDASRDLNIDRMFWHKEATQVLGPTRADQQAPELPDASFPALKGGKELMWEIEKGFWKERDGIFYSCGGGFLVRSANCLGADFTAELHLFIPSQNESCGIELETSAKTAYSIEFSSDAQKIILYKKEGLNKEVCKKEPLKGCRIYDALHKIEIVRAGEGLSLRFDGRSVLKAEIHGKLTGIGYFSEEMPIGVGYTAVTNSTYEKKLKQLVIPTDCSLVPLCATGKADSDEKGRVILKEGQKKEYKIRADRESWYRLYITAKQEKGGRYQVALDGETPVDCMDRKGLWEVGFWMESGVHRLTVEGIAGSTILERLEIAKQKKPSEGIKEAKISANAYEKKLLEEMTGDNYILETDFVVKEFGKKGSAGILVRVTEPAEGGEGKDQVLGIDFFKGYSVSVNGSVLSVAKHCYDRKVLGEIAFAVEKNREYKLYIVVLGCEIIVSNAKKEELIRVWDTHPLVRGCAGAWVQDSEMDLHICFKNTGV